ncbi:hypothetical protein CSKR_201629, partial [Clonorchis sinensis]
MTDSMTDSTGCLVEALEESKAAKALTSMGIHCKTVLRRADFTGHVKAWNMLSDSPPQAHRRPFFSAGDARAICFYLFEFLTFDLLLNRSGLTGRASNFRCLYS